MAKVIIRDTTSARTPIWAGEIYRETASAIIVRYATGRPGEYGERSFSKAAYVIEREPEPTCEHVTPNRTTGRGNIPTRCSRPARWVVVVRSAFVTGRSNDYRFCTYHAKRAGRVEVCQPIGKGER